MTCLSDAERAIEAACGYRKMGFCPIPSCPDAGHPIFPYARGRERGVSAACFAHWARKGSINLQVACGVRWGLVVVDVDGESAAAAWDGMTVYRPCPPTWTVRTPSGGFHLWFSLAPGSEPVPYLQMFKLPEAHESIDILGDGYLAKSPPSFKVVDGVRVPYSWLPGREPGSLPMAPLPAWVADLARRPLKSKVEPIRRPVPAPRRQALGKLPRFECDGVLDAITDKIDLARRWGLRIVHDRRNDAGWVPCHSIFREDRDPSAMFSCDTGRYWEPQMGRRPIGLFELAVAIGLYPDPVSAKVGLGVAYRARAAS